ncbi:hypothetical protein B0H10DRAFT_1829717 [Mycena sp. CBHHK59/15]|nr:hypothetical protein B0H10DRAFT_1829717 [Mycena sp. CBHHK59/15]
MYKDPSRPQCNILMQLCTGHSGLNNYLFHFKLAPSPLCAHCSVPESVPHFLLSCLVYHPQCLQLIVCLGTSRLSLHCLISAKSDASPVLTFVYESGHFPCYLA